MLSRIARKVAIGLAVALLGVPVTTACSPTQHAAGTPAHADDFGSPVAGRAVRAGGDLVMGLSSEPDRLDPTTSSSLYTRVVMNSICEKLYDNDSAGHLVPQLAAALPDISPDGLTVTVPLRTGPKFADGTDFDAEAVQLSLQRHLTMKTSQRTSEMGPIMRIDAVGADRVVLHFKSPFAPITAALADRAGMIMSPAALAAAGDYFGDHPVCVGPFKFVARVPQTSITVTRDPLYYDAAHVHLDGITYRIIADDNIRAANLRSGDVQVADTIAPADAQVLAGDSKLRLLQSSSLGFQGLTINLGNVDGVGKPVRPIDTPLARDPRIREALSLSIDRPQLVRTVFDGWFDSACTPIVPNSTYATAAGTTCPAYDPQRAKQLLTAAGVPAPYRIMMQVSNRQADLRYAQALQSSVAAGGFDLQIVPVEYSALLDVQKRGTFEALFLGWSGRIDPDANTARFLTTGSPGNYGGYSSPAMDDLLSRAGRVTDPGQRAGLYGQAVGLIEKDNPYLYTYRIRVLTGQSTAVAGVEVYPDGVVRLGKAAFLAG
ncbi:ABC transporter substrate-binding protein [Nocardia sp. alder85J]|uniref:ABC transporter substrate-binding protein n=1 Tax=Nocardia sp. alder85J TaxID=2862949 RepID=UPI001CD80722|nr:ABC transporter substrate-binding protein [Nocardia sp. alder85J]MCX4094184.1 ABC transporter substrate-binding protein [Nocardia sp. alder85J]